MYERYSFENAIVAGPCIFQLENSIIVVCITRYLCIFRQYDGLLLKLRFCCSPTPHFAFIYERNARRRNYT